MKFIIVLSLLLLVVKRRTALKIFRDRYGDQDRIPFPRCNNLKGDETIGIEYGTDCLCKEENNTFFDEGVFDCASMEQIKRHEGCKNSIITKQTNVKEEFNPRCTLENGKESIKIILRDHSDSGSVWTDEFSRDLVHALITINDNGIISFDHKPSYFVGVLVKIEFQCKTQTPTCIILKSEGLQTYPFIYEGPDAPPLPTTTTTTTTTSTTATPTTTLQTTTTTLPTTTTTKITQTTTEGTTLITTPQEPPTTTAQSTNVAIQSTTPPTPTTQPNPSTTVLQQLSTTNTEPPENSIPFSSTKVPSEETTTNSRSAIDDKSTSNDGGDDDGSVMVIIVVVVAVGVIFLILLVVFIVCRKRRNNGNAKASSAEDLGRDYASYSSEIAINKTDRNKNSLSIDLTDSAEYQDIGKTTPNYIPLESAFTNEAYTDLEGNNPEYRELEPEPVVYNVLEEPVYQETSKPLPKEKPVYHANPQPPMAPPERRRQPPKPPTPYQPSKPVVSPPSQLEQEDYYSAAASPPQVPHDIAALYAPVIKPKK
ncbi:uncharacterized protein [Clytia hemisphaerica]|uniref:Cnidarian restricted protein n=1 Tax=Clytia hemisphaerica TaxID=252671 RepID=A0A7M5XHF1_9CNID